MLYDEPVSTPDNLTPRQREVLMLVARGLTNVQIAERLFLSESSVKQRLRQAYKILGVKNRTEAVKLLRNG
jgi:DNA-binding NarL/FixJ family response regulator